jgi:hypothetical protein
VKGPAPSGPLVWAGRVLLVVCSLGAGFFFLSRWAINAPGLGARDAGLALSLSFANPLSLYACTALSLAAGVLGAGAALTRRPWSTFVWAALVAALPIAYLAVRG